jgi:hypothetical protein
MFSGIKGDYLVAVADMTSRVVDFLAGTVIGWKRSEAIGERLPQWYDMGSTATSGRLSCVALLEPCRALVLHLALRCVAPPSKPYAVCAVRLCASMA